MNNIKFRGLSAGRVWCYGFYTEENNVGYIRNEKGFVIRVDKNTVGQFTGLVDASGKEIYAGDKVKRRIMQDGADFIDMICEVRWAKWCHCLYIHDKYITCLDTAVANGCSIVGNIHLTYKQLTIPAPLQFPHLFKKLDPAN